MPTLDKLQIAQPQPATMRLQAMKMGDQLKRTNLYERGLDLQEQTLDYNKQKAQVDAYLRQTKQIADAINVASSKGTSKAEKERIYKASVAGIPTAPKLEFDEILGTTKITLNDGTVIEGPEDKVRKFSTHIGNDPMSVAGENKNKALQWAVEVGGLSVTQAPEEKDYTLSPGQQRRSGETNKVLATGLPKKEGPLVVNRIGDKSMTELGKEMGKDLVTQRKDVEGSVQSLKNIHEAKKLLDSGVITGVGAKFITDVGNVLSTRLGFHAFDDPVKNTEAYFSIIGMQVGQIIKQFGSGTGLSDADREYAERIVAGDITLTEKSLRKIIDINERGHRNIIKDFNKKADQVMKKEGSSELPYDLRVHMPQFEENLKLDADALIQKYSGQQ